MPRVYYVLREPKRYGFGHFLWDCFMTCLTCGFWIIWIFVREMRKPRI